MAKHSRRKKVLIIIGVILAVVMVGIGSFLGFTEYQLNKIPKMSFEEMLSYTTKNNSKAVIAVGIIQNGETSYKLYGENGTELRQKEHIYEIGSITKTFTAALLFKAIGEGKVNLDDSIDKYLDLPKKDYYPTLKRIITHTAGYKDYYFETQMISNFFKSRNDYYGISKGKLVDRIGKISLKNKDYNYEYSSFGISVIGAVLAEIYQGEYTAIIDAYIKQELKLEHTKISDGKGDLGSYWDWAENDAYLPAGGLTSTIEDMLTYAKLQLSGTQSYLTDTHNVITDVNATSSKNAKMNINIDSMGAAWIIDNKNNVIWHNGGTGNYNSYIGFDKEKQIAVVILSNLSPNYRIPATVMGIKLLTDLQKQI